MKKQLSALFLSAVLGLNLIGSAFAAEVDGQPGQLVYGTDSAGNTVIIELDDQGAIPENKKDVVGDRELTNASGDTVKPFKPTTGDDDGDDDKEPVTPKPPVRPTTPSSGGSSSIDHQISGASGSSANGSWSADLTSATTGQKVTITTKANTGFIGKAEVKDAANRDVKVTDEGNGVFSFTMPNGTVTINVTFVAGFPFTDVKTTDTFYSAVKYCYEHDLIQGTSSTTFAPKATINRAQIVTILWRQAGAPVQTAQGMFSDMPANSDYYNAILWAANLGIARGYGDGSFRPADPINRQELATFLYRYETLYLKKAATGSAASLNNYADRTYVSSWAEAEMRWAVGNDILPETAAGLVPTGNAPRYQAAMAMMEYCQKMLGIL